MKESLKHSLVLPSAGMQTFRIWHKFFLIVSLDHRILAVLGNVFMFPLPKKKNWIKLTEHEKVEQIPDTVFLLSYFQKETVEDFDAMYFIFSYFLESKSLVVSLRECNTLLTPSERCTERDTG